MRVVAAYMMAVLGGKDNPTADDITKILESVGIKADEADIERVIKQLQGKDLNKLIDEGAKKLAAVPSAGGAGAGAAAAGDAAAAKKEEEAPAEAEKEESEESDADMGLSLFD